MNRIFITLLVALFAALSCSVSPIEREVVFHVGGVPSGSIPTKAYEGVNSALSASFPSDVPTIKLTSKTSPARTYSVAAGVPSTVALDSYKVGGTVSPGKSSPILYGRVYEQSPYLIDDEVTVTDGVDSYTLSARFHCFALVYDKSVVESIQIQDTANGYLSPTFCGGDDSYGAYFIVGTWTSTPLRVIVTPVDKVNYEAVEYSIYTQPGKNLSVEPGKWYLLSPTEVVVTSGTFSIASPVWESGM